MNIHEYQAKNLLKEYGVQVLNGFLVENMNQLEPALRRIETDVAVIKAQVHTGGRGKAGGVKLVKSMTEALEVGQKMFRSRLITHQTTEEGVLVRKLYIEEGCDIAKEYYLSFVLDRNQSCITIIASPFGGMDIEDVAKNNPEGIFKLPIDVGYGIKDYEIMTLADQLGLSRAVHGEFKQVVKSIYKLYLDRDCNMIEINPLVLTKDENLVALDAKIDFDDNALYRQEDNWLLRDIDEIDAKELKASEYGLSYISLDGHIACMVNGAGLAMATIDGITAAGGEPANFLDVGGSASSDNIAKAMEIILGDEQAKGIFINIFGGIMKCDVVAEGLLKATDNQDVNMPIVVRLEGTNEQEGKSLLLSSNLNVEIVRSLDEGAKRIVALSGGQ